jgi:colicin import membrane protein
MADPGKPKRPYPKSERPHSQPPQRDARVERSSANPGAFTTPRAQAAQEHAVRLRRTSSLPRVDAAPARIAALEIELARLAEERGAEADELARMLVRIAEAERARAAAEERSAALAERVRELDAQREKGLSEVEAVRQELRRGAEVAEMAARRAGLAEKSASDGAAALERTGAELQADRARVTDLETRLARTKREHLAELAKLRDEHDEANARATRALEEERAAAERARQQAAAAEVDRAAMQNAIARTATLVDEMDRREEMTSALRTRALDEARRILAVQAISVCGVAPAIPTDEIDLDLPDQ